MADPVPDEDEEPPSLLELAVPLALDEDVDPDLLIVSMR